MATGPRKPRTGDPANPASKARTSQAQKPAAQKPSTKKTRAPGDSAETPASEAKQRPTTKKPAANKKTLSEQKTTTGHELPKKRKAEAAATSKAPSAETKQKTQPAPEPPESEFVESGSWLAIFDIRRMSSMGVSMLVHAVAIIILGILVVQLPPDDDNPSIVAAPLAKEDTEIEEMVEVEIEETAELSTAVQAAMPAMKVDLSGSTATLSDVAMTNISVGLGLGDMSGKDLMQEIGGAAGVTTFFGIKSTGTKFIYVVDNSKSMNGGRFENACAEVMRSVDRLGPKQSFYVIFFSDKAYPLFHPTPAAGLVSATDVNKEKLRIWMETVPLVLKTNGKEAIFGALAMKPDAIYLLTDGRFGDKADQDLMLLQGNTIPIHTIAFDSKAGEEPLKMIAARHNGTYRFVKKDGTQEVPTPK